MIPDNRISREVSLYDTSFLQTAHGLQTHHLAKLLSYSELFDSE